MSLPGRAAALVLAVSLAAPLGAVAADKVTVPIGSTARRPEALPPGEQIQLTLERAIALALQNTLDLTVSSQAYESAGFSIGSAEGIFDPALAANLLFTRTQSPVFQSFQASDTKTVDANVSVGGLSPIGTQYSLGLTNHRRDSPVNSPGFFQINPTLSSGFGLGITQPLLKNFGSDVNRRLIVQARIARDQAAWDFVRSVQTTVQNVEYAYWDLVYAYANLKAKQEALDRAKDLNRITRIKIDVGALAPIDIVQTEVTIAQREQEIILAEGQIGDANDRLKRLLNVNTQADWARPIDPTDRPQDLKADLDVEAGVRRAMETRPEVKQAVVDIESKKIQLAYNRNQVKPRLDFVGSYGFNGVGASTCIPNADGSGTCQEIQYNNAYEQIVRGDYPSWTVGLNFALPIFNKTAKNNAAIAATNLELARTNLALLKQNLTVEVRAAARTVDTAYRSVAAARKARELAERNLDAERKKYENGMTTSFQVSQIQNDLTTARSNELLAIAAYVKSLAAWHRAIGDLLPERGIEVAGIPVTMEATPPEEGAVR